MTASLTPDLCVIGAGAGGLAVAAGAAALGSAVVIVEKGDMGGQSLNRGSIPSRALIAAGRAAFVMRTAERFGIRAQEPWVDYARTQAYLREVIASIAPNQSVARMEAMNVKVIRGAARFTSKTTVEAGGIPLEPRRFVVATGSSPIIPPIPGLEQVRSLTTDSIFDLNILPTRLIIVGTAGDGLALGQAFRRLGCEVTILETGRALADEESELAELLLAQLTREGIVLRENVEILRAEPRGAGVRVVLTGKVLEETIDGSHLLIASGRAPNVDGLGLESAGIVFDKSGIRVDRNLRSSNRRVYAVGDVAGAPFSVAAAADQAATVLRTNSLRLPAKRDPAAIPRITFTDPEIATAGLREDEARRRYGAIRVLRWPFAENDRARTDGIAAGHIKVILSKRDTVLGVGIVGPQAGELISLWQLAISNALKVDDVADVILAYPTLSDVSKYAAATARAGPWRNLWANRMMRLMRAFG